MISCTSDTNTELDRGRLNMELGGADCIINLIIDVGNPPQICLVCVCVVLVAATWGD